MALPVGVRTGLLVGAVLLGVATVAVDSAVPSLTLSPLGTLAVLGVTLAAGSRWGVVAAAALAAAFAVTLNEPQARPHVMLVAQAAAIMVGYCLAIVLLGVARRQEASIAGFESERGGAKEFHDLLLANDLKLTAAWRLEVAHVPLGDLGGDFYGVVRDGEDLGLIVADVMGKGLRAAMLLSALKLVVQAERNAGCAAMLTQLNRYLSADRSADMFCTAWYGRLKPDGSLRYAVAGHEPAVVRRASGETFPLRTGGLPLGVDLSTVFPEYELTLQSGDALAVYTDGLGDLLENGLSEDMVFAGAAALERAVASRRRRDDVLVVVAARLPANPNYGTGTLT